MNRRTFLATISALAAVPAGAKPQPRLDVRNIPVSYFPKFDLNAASELCIRVIEKNRPKDTSGLSNSVIYFDDRLIDTPPAVQFDILCGHGAFGSALNARRPSYYPIFTDYHSQTLAFNDQSGEVVFLKYVPERQVPANQIWVVQWNVVAIKESCIRHVLVFGDIPSKGKR